MSDIDLSSNYWDKRYLEQSHKWDIGFPSNPLKEYIEQLNVAREIEILIPGCGSAYEVEIALDLGFKNITCLDFSAIVCQGLKAKFGKDIQVCEGDFFMHEGRYDLILEQTFFCAINPNLRNSYALKMKELLKENGKLVGVFFTKKFENPGPPFGGTKEEYLEYFNEIGKVRVFEPCYNSITPRLGSESFVIIEKN
jgi:methyl halide transferase